MESIEVPAASDFAASDFIVPLAASPFGAGVACVSVWAGAVVPEFDCANVGETMPAEIKAAAETAVSKLLRILSSCLLLSSIDFVLDNTGDAVRFPTND
ncbi:hypothetical protein [Amorphus suaedae]